MDFSDDILKLFFFINFGILLVSESWECYFFYWQVKHCHHMPPTNQNLYTNNLVTFRTLLISKLLCYAWVVSVTFESWPWFHIRWRVDGHKSKDWWVSLNETSSGTVWQRQQERQFKICLLRVPVCPCSASYLCWTGVSWWLYFTKLSS